MTAPKTSSAFRNAHCRVYPTRDGNWLDVAIIGVKPRSSSRPGSWAWGQLAEGQQSGLLSCTCMFGSFSNSLFPSANRVPSLQAQDALIIGKQQHKVFRLKVGECLENWPQYLCLGKEGTALLTAKFSIQS